MGRASYSQRNGRHMPMERARETGFRHRGRMVTFDSDEHHGLVTEDSWPYPEHEVMAMEQDRYAVLNSMTVKELAAEAKTLGLRRFKGGHRLNGPELLVSILTAEGLPAL
jgi:hypothetical protein